MADTRPDVGTPVLVTHIDEIGTVVPTGRDVSTDEVDVMVHRARYGGREGSITTFPVHALRELRIVDDEAAP